MIGDLCITGRRTTIVTELFGMIDGVNVNWFSPPRRITEIEFHDEFPLDAARYVFAHGVLYPDAILEQSGSRIEESLAGNLITTVQMCEAVLRANSAARICVIGSMSGILGSHDTTYALAKAALHRYVETRRVGPDQQLVCVAPSIILDSGMTQRRADLADVQKSAAGLPKKRLLTAKEVARLIKFLLWDDLGYITNCVIPMDGGKRATMTGGQECP